MKRKMLIGARGDGHCPRLRDACVRGGRCRKGKGEIHHLHGLPRDPRLSQCVSQLSGASGGEGNTPSTSSPRSKRYKSGRRGHKTMQAQAVSLSEQDMQDIAAYFASAAGE